MEIHVVKILAKIRNYVSKNRPRLFVGFPHSFRPFIYKKYKYELDRPEREAAELRTKEGHERVEAALEEGRRRQEAYKKKMGITIGGSLKKTKKNKKY